MKSKFEIIVETKQYYDTDPSRRAVTVGNQCQYCTEDNRRCAFGRCCTEEGLHKLKQINYTGSSPSVKYDGRIGKIHITELLKPEYNHNDPVFWIGLQNLHDHRLCWNNKGLTSQGQAVYDTLINMYYEESNENQT